MTTKADNGGAIAIKGFNYQKASIILVMINNYHRDDFTVIPEADDDFQVHIEGKNIFIQVKGEKSITLKKLINEEIIEKNLMRGEDNDIRKIFIWDIGKTFQNDLIETKTGNIISPLLKYSNDNEKKIVESLNLDVIQQKRLSNQYIYKTPFSNNFSEEIRCLFGEMVIQELHVDNESGRALLAELSLMIDQKSEILLDGSNYQEKEITGDYLKELFVQVQKIEMFDKILANLSYNTFKKEKIKLERTKIPIAYNSTKKRVKSNCYSLDIENSAEQELVNNVVEIIENSNNSITNENLKIAIAIECLCELWEDKL